MISLQEDDLDQPRQHVLATDLLLAVGYPYKELSPAESSWAPIFFSKDWVADHDNIRPENFGFNASQLCRLGVQVSELR